MKKILFTLFILCVTAGVSFAYITVEEARSKDYLLKEGFSEQATIIIQKKSGEYNPEPTNKWQKTGFGIWNYIDPMSPRPRDEKTHNIKPYSSFSDL